MIQLSAARPSMLSAAMSKMPADFDTSPGSNLSKLIESYIDAMLAAARSSLTSLRVVSAPVLGGVAVPGGPVTGALLTVSPGSAIFKPSEATALYEPPRFSMTMPDGELRTGKYTPWLRAFTRSILPETDKALNAWLTSWGVASAPVVVGGVAGWIPSAPPAPGPWVGGTVLPFPFVGGPASAPSPLPLATADTAVASGRRETAAVDVGDPNPISVPVVLAGGQGETFLRALAASFTELVKFAGTIPVLDKSGAGGTGVAAPGGVITGTIAELSLDVT